MIFLLPDNAHVLILDAKLLANQTYDEATMKRVGCKFNIEQTSSTLFTGFYQRILRSFQLKSMSQALPVVPAPWRSPPVRAPRTIPEMIRKAGRTSGPSSVVRPGTLALNGSWILILHMKQASSVPLFCSRFSLSWGSFTCDTFVNRKRNNRRRIQSNLTHHAGNLHPGCVYT